MKNLKLHKPCPLYVNINIQSRSCFRFVGGVVGLSMSVENDQRKSTCSMKITDHVRTLEFKCLMKMIIRSDLEMNGQESLSSGGE